MKLLRKNYLKAGLDAIFAAIKITGGTPGAGKVLTSDADGDATWENAPTGTVPDSGSDTTVIMQGAGDGTWDVKTPEEALGYLISPLSHAPGVALTAAASGGGIQVADNDNIDFGTGNFALVWKGSLPDWTPSAAGQRLLEKLEGTTGFAFIVETDGRIFVVLYRGGVTTFYSTVAPSLVDGTVHELVASITRETAAVAGSILFAVDGVQLGNLVPITTASAVSISNANPLQVLGSGVTRYAGTTHHAYTLNFAPTAAEVKDMYLNGIPEAWKWGSQTSLVGGSNCENRSGGTFVYETLDGLSATGFHAVKTGTTNQANAGTADEIPFLAGYRYALEFDATLTSGTAPNVLLSDSLSGGGIHTEGSQTAVSGANAFIFNVNTTCTGVVNFLSFAEVTTEFTIAGIVVRKLGATLDLEPEGIQASPGQWFDNSTNKNHAKMPIAGATVTQRKKDFEVRWTNTWAGTHEAQYLGGVNESILPPNCYIQSIIGVIAGSTIEDIILGDGSDTDHWVAITTGLAAGTVAFTVANPISDGTNYKLVVDPDANFTGSIIWTIKGIVLEA